MLGTVRERAGDALFARVAGPDGAANRTRIQDAPGPRWFAAGSPIQRVHGDAAMFVGGLRALLLQSLHPSAMAAVAAHSGYRADPWGRLARTSTFLAVTTFGPAGDAQTAVDRVRAIHDRVRGRTAAGVPYVAGDPHLLTWVHVAEVDSFLRAHQVYGARALDPAQADEYVAQTAVVARALGAHDPPTDVRALAATLGAYRDELSATAEARDTAAFLLREPPVPRPARPGYGVLAAAAVALLPRETRAMLGVGDHPWLDATLARAGGHAVTAAIRWALPSGAPVTS